MKYVRRRDHFISYRNLFCLFIFLQTYVRQLPRIFLTVFRTASPRRRQTFLSSLSQYCFAIGEVHAWAQSPPDAVRTRTYVLPVFIYLFYSTSAEIFEPSPRMSRARAEGYLGLRIILIITVNIIINNIIVHIQTQNNRRRSNYSIIISATCVQNI